MIVKLDFLRKACKDKDCFFVILLLLILIYLIILGGEYFYYAFNIMIYPYDIDGGEGHCLQGAVALLRGESIYRPIDQEPYTIMNYPPFFEIILSGLVKFLGPRLLWGRFIAIASTLMSVYFIRQIVFKVTNNGLSSTIAGLLFLSSEWLQNWSVLCRVDMLSIFLTLAGLYYFINASRDGGKQNFVISVMCFIGAFFTKQNAVAGPLSCVFILALQRFLPGYCDGFRNGHHHRKQDFKGEGLFIIMLISLTMLLLVILTMLTRGQFLQHSITYTIGSFSWSRYFDWLKLFFHAHWLITSMAFLFIAVSVVTKRISAIWFFWIISLAITMTAGKVGSAINYFLEFWAANCILIGLILNSIGEKNVLGLKGVVGKTLVMLCLALQLVIFEDSRDLALPTLEHRRSGEYIAGLIRNTDGDVLSEYTGYVAQSGKKIIYQSFPMTQLAKRGKWDQKLLLDDIRGGRFDLIIISKVGLETGRWTREMINYIHEYYKLINTVHCFELSYFKHSTSELDIYIPRMGQ